MRKLFGAAFGIAFLFLSFANATEITLTGAGSVGIVPIGTPSQLGFNSTGTTYDTNPLSITGANIPANSTVVVFTGAFNNQDGTSANPISGVSDGTNSYSLAVAASNGVNAFYQIWYFYYSSASPSTTITTSFSKINRLKVISAVSISGVITPSPVDKTASSGGTGTSASTVSGVLSTSNQIVFAGSFIDGGTSYSPGSGFTNAYNNTNSASQRFTIDYQKVSSTSSVTHADSWTGSAIWNDVLATFKGN